MPRLGVPSTTDSARVIADVCGEPAPLPRSINPRHNDRPGGTFPRVVQPLIETWEKGRKEGARSPPRGRKPRVQAAAQWRRFHVPRPTSKRASSASIPTPTPPPPATPAKPLISRSFQSGGKAGRTVRGLSRVGRDLGQAQEKTRLSGLDSATKPTRYARPLALRRKLPLRRDFHGDRVDRPADRAARAAAPASRSKPSAMARKSFPEN
jgi:hypothetical protein